jgi:hypothetical protein
MTLSLRDRQSSFFDVSFLASNLFDGKDPYSLFRQKVLPALEAQREQLGAMYCATNGRPAIDPVLVAGVTLLQFMEKAPDRQAIERLRLHLGWKGPQTRCIAFGDPSMRWVWRWTTRGFIRRRWCISASGGWSINRAGWPSTRCCRGWRKMA